MERYSFSDEEMEYMIENYEQDLISLYWTTKVNSSEADKICQKINRKWCKEGQTYIYQ